MCCVGVYLSACVHVCVDAQHGHHLNSQLTFGDRVSLTMPEAFSFSPAVWPGSPSHPPACFPGAGIADWCCCVRVCGCECSSWLCSRGFARRAVSPTNLCFKLDEGWCLIPGLYAPPSGNGMTLDPYNVEPVSYLELRPPGDGPFFYVNRMF